MRKVATVILGVSMLFVGFALGSGVPFGSAQEKPIVAEAPDAKPAVLERPAAEPGPEQVKVFYGAVDKYHTTDLEHDMNRWLTREKPDVIRTTQSSNGLTGGVVIIVFYREKPKQ
jgi:hypothetical protein